jgi:uncharacterized protein (TIGR02145 family)
MQPQLKKLYHLRNKLNQFNMKKNNICSLFSLMIIGFFMLAMAGCSKDEDTTTNTVTDFDGNIYHTVTIGTQVWMVENLKVTHYSNGDPIPLTAFNTQITTPAYTNYLNRPDTSKVYGCLYNWFAVSDSRKIAPKGWHVPTYDDWTKLITYLGGEEAAGDKLKEAGSKHWRSPNAGATNQTGFTALPGGSLTNPIGHIGLWWSSTAVDQDWAFFYKILSLNHGVYKCSDVKKDMFSVRCVKD